MKKHLWMSLVLLFLIVITSVTTAQSNHITDIQSPIITPTESIATTSNDTTLLFLGNQNLAPVIFLDDTIPSGVAVDIVHELAKHMPEPIKIKAMNWSEAQELVARGDADALIQINPTEERKKIYDFSDTLLESKFSIFTRSDKMGISGISSLRGLRVGVESGGLPQKVLEKDSLIQIIIIPNFLEGFKQLNEGSLDAVVVDYRVGSYILAENNIRNIRVIGEPITFSFSSIAVKKGDVKLLNEINHALQIIKTDGTYQKILNNWEPVEGVFQTQEQIKEGIYSVIILILLILFLIAVIWIITIKIELTKRKTAEEKLKEQYSTLNGIINSAHALIFSVDRQYRYTSFNKGHADVMKALYGAQIEHGNCLLDYMTVPEDRETAKLNLNRALAGNFLIEEAYSGEKLRTRQYFQVSHSPIKSEKKEIIGVAVLAQDMTERKQAEDDLRESKNRLETVISNIPMILFAIDKELRFTISEGLGLKKLNLNPNQVVGLRIEDVYAAYPDIIARCKETLQGKPQSYQSNVNDIFFDIYSTPLYNNDGVIYGLIGIASDITEQKMAHDALNRANKKLNLLNSITFSDIQNAIFSLSGYLDLEQSMAQDEELQKYLDKEIQIVKTILESLKFAKYYQNLGLQPPTWQNVNQTFIFGISHLDISKLSRNLNIEGLEIYADPLLENVFFTFAKNVIQHGKNATGITLSYYISLEGLTLVFEDNGEGISYDMKEKIFNQQYAEKKGRGLFLSREILSITDITIRETGEPGKGARFEISVPKGRYRFTNL